MIGSLHIPCVGGISLTLGNHTGKANVFASIAFQHTDLFWLGRIPGLETYLIPEQPLSPSVRDTVGREHVHFARFGPMLYPPVRAMKAPEIPAPVRFQMTGKPIRELVL